MSMATLLSAGLLGIEAHVIHVELDITRGLPGWSTVGLAESAVKESKERVKSAIYNSGYSFPPQRITLNLAPADVKKSGTALDLSIAIGLLAASDLIPKTSLKNFLILGELSLSGFLRPVRGTLSTAILAKQMGLQGIIVPEENVWEAQPIQGIEVWGARDLPSVVEYFRGSPSLKSPQDLPNPPAPPEPVYPDFSEVRGQEQAKRALEIAAAGYHHVLMVGPPGTGKSMLAQRLSSILPQMSFEEGLDTTKIYSLMGMLKPGGGLMKERVFRAPHHTISDAGLIGGGSHPRPGEITLAHNGVLFLDELTEFRRNVLESLRQPLENLTVTISRALQNLTFPARFLLAAAMNPCPCGHLGNSQGICLCPPIQIQKYQNKISGPLLDRIDIRVSVPPIDTRELQRGASGESSDKIRNRVGLAWERQNQRFKGLKIFSNSQMGSKEIQKFCPLGAQEENFMEKAIKKWKLSTRAYHRILKVARTIGDLEGRDNIGTHHLGEALGYRLLGKKALG